jgi:hypothetical protein
MFRRLCTVAVAASLGVAVLPALPAFASATATSELRAGSEVFPGARTFTIRIRNNEQLLLGKTINAIRVNFPVNEAGVRLGSGPGVAEGFTGTATNLGTTQFITYRGGSLRPGSSLDVTFPASVGAPLAKDLIGDFRVQVSSDDFATSRSATGALSTSVRVLEIVQEALKPVAPTSADGRKGVTDRTGTAGQAIVYGSTVRNHARNDLDVVATLTSTSGDTATPVSVLVPAGSTAPAQIPVQLAGAGADRVTTFTAEVNTAGAAAPKKTDSFTVQAPATLAFSDLQPTRTRSGDGADREFSALATKAGTPALDVASTTLAFGQNSATATGVAFAGAAAAQRITWSMLGIVGEDGPAGATINAAATDENLASYVFDAPVGSIEIDNAPPLPTALVTLPTDADHGLQTAAKNGDVITVSGKISDASDLVASTLRVILDPDVGADTTVPVTLTGTGSERSYTGTAKPTFDPAATSFTAKVEVADLAGNIGSAGTSETPTAVDNFPPVLADKGQVVAPQLIDVRFLEDVAGGCNPNAWSIAGVPGSVIEVRRADGSVCQTRGAGGYTLVLRNTLGVDDTPRVTYEAPDARLVAKPAKDGAGNLAGRQSVNTVTSLVPLEPVVSKVERRDGALYESAYSDGTDKAYYTNTAGAEALRLTVEGIRKGYTVEVVQGTDVIQSATFTKDPAPLATSYSGTVLVPLAEVDGANELAVRFVSANGNAGPGALLTVVLDTVAPQIAQSTVSAADSVDVTFSEAIVSGTDFSGDWFVSETVDTEEGTATRLVNADSVSAPDALTRVLKAELLQADRFVGADYLVNSPNGLRYEDRAGNVLMDTITPASS